MSLGAVCPLPERMETQRPSARWDHIHPHLLPMDAPDLGKKKIDSLKPRSCWMEFGPPTPVPPSSPHSASPGTPQFFGVTDSQAATIQPGPRRPERPRSEVFLLPPNSVSLFEGQFSRFRDNAAPGGVRLANAGESFTPDYTTPGTTPGRCCQSASNSSSAPSPVNPSLIRREPTSGNNYGARSCRE